MHASAKFRIFGLLLMLLSLSFIPPLFIEFIYKDGDPFTFYISFLATLGVGFLLWFPFRTHRYPMRTHDGFLIIVLFWLIISLVGALPFWWTIEPNISFTNAFFESVSGITTTGSTILTGLDNLPHSILFYRQQLQFLGGISIIILAVGILPALGIGGMQLFRNEMTGPVKDDKLTPRITHTAKLIWMVYVAITIVCIFCYKIAGMNWFDAVGHGFSTVSTGGFSTHDANIGYFNGPYIKIIAMFFMVLGAINFNLHYLVFKRRSLKLYLQDPELRLYLKLLLGATIITWAGLGLYSVKHTLPHSVLDAFFQTISLATTSGFSAADFSTWPLFLPLMLLFMGAIGGCAGSTAGGIKVVRVLLLQKQAGREINRLIHPHGQYMIKLGQTPLSQRIIEAIWGFIAIYFVVFTVLLLLLLVAEEDFLTMYSALVTSISNTGHGLGLVLHNFALLTDYSKWVLSFAMLAGRLEIFTLLVIFSPAFWNR